MIKTVKTQANSINRALDQIGDKWVLLVIQEVFWGVNTFNDLMNATGVSRGVLADRLRWLQEIDCLRKKIPVNNPKRPTYHLTRKSMDLYHCALMAINWERQFYETPELDRVKLVHDGCGKVFWPVMCCVYCHDVINAEDVTYIEGPGAKSDVRKMKVRRRSSISAYDIPSEHSIYKNLINVVGDRWTANLIVLAFIQYKRFDEFHSGLPIATNILSDRLKLLTEEGVFKQVPYQQNPTRHEYHLTKKGNALFPYFLSLLQWGDKWCDQGQGAPVVVTHTTCGHHLGSEVRCGECNGSLNAKKVHLTL